MSSAAPAFPRGGGREAGGAKRKRKASKGPEFLFGGEDATASAAAEKKPAKKRVKTTKAAAVQRKVKAKTKAKAASGAGLGLLAAAARTPYVKPMSARAASLGAQFLGIVAAVHGDYVTVALPNNLKGRLHREAVSEHFKTAETDALPLSEVFAVGQVLRCALLRRSATSHGSMALELSTSARALNRGLAPRELRTGMPFYVTVKSVEDHGYVCETGMAGVTAFLPKKNVDAELKEGQGVETVIQGRVASALRLRVPTQERLAKAKVTAAIRFQAIQAGMLVKGVVDRQVSNGLVLSSVLGAFSGTVQDTHLEYPCLASEWPEVYRVGQIVTARVLHVDTQKDTLVLTLRRHLVDVMAAPELGTPEMRIGAVVEEAEVLSVTPGIGVLFGKRVPRAREDEDEEAKTEEEDGEDEAAEAARLPHRMGFFVHISRLADDFVESAEKMVKVGDHRRLRVLDLLPNEGWANASLQRSMLDASVVRYEDCTPGMAVEATILKLESYGLLVACGQGVRGIVTNMHLSDVPLRRAEPSRFRTGAKVKARVLTVDPAQRKLHLTLKRAFVRAEDTALITNFGDCEVGRAATGFVSRVTPAGVTVTFLGNTHGFVPARSLSDDLDGQSPTDIYAQGQVVRVTTRALDETRTPPRLLLSLDAGGPTPRDTPLAKLGSHVRGVVGAIGERSIELEATDEAGETVSAVLDLEHLADDATTSRRMASLLRSGDVLEQLRIVAQDAIKGRVVVTAQPLLLRARLRPASPGDAEEGREGDFLPSAFDAVERGQICAGTITGITGAGIFIRFAQKLSGLCPVSQILGEADAFHVGDAVRCRIKHVDAERKRFTCSFRDLDAGADGYLESLLNGVSAVGDGIVVPRAAGPSPCAPPAWRRYPIGSTHAATVSAPRPYGLVLTFLDDAGVMVLVPPECCPGGEAGVQGATAGTELKVRVVDMDAEKALLVGSLEPEVVRRGRPKFRKELGRLAEGDAVLGRVLLARPGAGYAVVETPDGVLGIVGGAYHHRRGVGGVGTKLDLEVAQTNNPELTHRKATKGLAPGTSAFAACAFLRRKIEDTPAARGSRERTAVANEAATGGTKRKRKDAIEGEGAGAPASLRVGDAVEAVVLDVREGGAVLEVEVGNRGRRATLDMLHSFPADSTKSLLEDLSEGSRVEAFVLDANKKVLQLTAERLSPADIAAIDAAGVPAPPTLREARRRRDRFVGVITATNMEESPPAVRIALGGNLAGVAAIHQWIAPSPVDLKRWRQKLRPGLHCVVSGAHTQAKQRRARKASADGSASAFRVMLHILEGDAAPRLRPWLPVPTEAAAVPAPHDVALGELLWGVVDRRVAAGDAPALQVWLASRAAVKLGRTRVNFGRVCATEACDEAAWADFSFQRDATEDPKGLRHGDVVQAMAFGAENGRLELSLRSQRIAAAKKGDAAAALRDDQAPKVGALAKGFVSGVRAGIGAFVRLSRQDTGVVLFRDLSDGFVAQPSEEFPVGKLVVARIKDVHADADGRKRLSLRASEVVEAGRLGFEDITVGMRLTGEVARVEEFGVFVRLAGARERLTGLCHKSEAADDFMSLEALRARFRPGDAVRVAVLRKNAEKKQLSLTMKASHFEGAEEDDVNGAMEEPDAMDQQENPRAADQDDLKDAASEGPVLEAMDLEDDEGDDDDDLDVEAIMREAREREDSDEESDGESDDEDDDAEGEPDDGVGGVDLGLAGLHAQEDHDVMDAAGGAEAKDEIADDEDEDDDDEEVEEEEDEDEGGIGGAGLLAVAPGALPGGAFAWDDFTLPRASSAAAPAGTESEDSDDDDEDEDEGSAGGGRSKRARGKARKAREEEAALRQREEELLDGGAAPETPEDFERLVVARPNSSFVWIRYIAFRLSLADVEGARKLAARALSAIHYKEEAEKANIFAAWMNLELQFGDAVTLQAVLNRACATCDPKDMHLRLLGALEAATQDDLAIDVIKKARKKFPGDPEVARAEVAWQLKRRGPEAATQALQRSLRSLEKRHHVDAVRHLGVALYKTKEAKGAIARAREAFEGLVEAAPKRSDLWFVWVDQELTTGDVRAARRILERMATLRWKVRIAKQLFSKWLELEMEHGDAASADAVKDRARSYIENM